MSLLDDARYLADLADDTLRAPHIAAKWLIGNSTVKDHRKKLGISVQAAAAEVVTRGDVTEHSSDGSRSITAVRDRPITLADARAWIASSGDQPDDYTLSIKSIAYGLEMFSNKMSATPKHKAQAETPNDFDLPALYAEVARTEYAPHIDCNASGTRTTTVVVWADMQLGKVGGRGDTAGLIERLAQKRAALERYMFENYTSDTVFIDAGDPIEGFENVAAQMFTNDLSLPQQVDMAAVEMWKTLALMSSFGPVDAVAVPSNHGAWRAGKQSLGKPSDDWGLTIQSRLKFQAELVGLPITFHKPSDWDESVAVDVRGTKLGVHHGHQAACDQMPKWWAGQQHGAQATADADVLVTGHYHHLRVQPTGRSIRTGKSKWWLQAPTLDNGSDWYRNRAGDDSDPGLLVFQINDAGFDLQSLAVL
ncbi:hypothetical protein E3T54_02870 [Cryobacterium sp. Sr8]|uniref:hypothetical protein n=1 Tax=Cryobacterium sp. Sr8 TaxID=1259203 RepID=UPI00106BA48C|nr:hypothetical protein [Cryobacterium sp. Sr8]TFD80701.1 hypothetical protein E3T54_02870 [Cryobacterium sp. Sr8]